MNLKPCMILIASLAALISALSGCGTLTEKTGGLKLTPQAMKFAKNIPPSSTTLELSCKGSYAETNTWASKVYPIFPVFYWSDLGFFKTPPPSYGVRSATIIFPLLWVMRDSVYDARGVRTNAETTFSMDFIIGYEDRLGPDSTSDFKVGILWIPGIGPFLGAGPEFFQFFWVPFSNYQ